MPHRPIATALAVLALTACGGKPRSAEAPEWVKTGEIPGGDPYRELDGKPKAAPEKKTEKPVDKPAAKTSEEPRPGAEPKATEPVVTKVNDVPAWVKKPPQQEGMLFGIGGAQKGVGSRDAAQKKANVDLSAQICLSLKAVSTTKERYTDKTFGGKRTETAEMTMEQNIETKVAQEAIPGVTVREVAETDKETWVLVACDRAAWAASIRKSIADVDQGLTAQGEELKREAAPSLGVMARASKQILALAAERTVLLRRLRVADPVGELPKAPIDIERFKTDLAKALDAVTISVVAKIGAGGANDALLTNRIAGALGNAGLGVVAEGKPSQLKITFIARFQELTIDEEKKRVNVNLAASFTGADGKQLGSLEAKGSGLSTPDIARDKALDEAVKNVLLEFDKQVFDLLARL